MSHTDPQNNQKSCVLEVPADPLPVIFESPHSGRDYPEDFNYACNYNDLIRMEDRYVEDLFSAAPSKGASLLYALFPRSYIDVNRAIDDIDPNLIDGKWLHEEHGKIAPSARSDAGIGLIPRLIKPGKPIYSRTLTPDEIKSRINTFYAPYHTKLQQYIEESHYRFGKVWHVSCHSMPSTSAYPKRTPRLIGYTEQPCDFVLGDRDGTTCGREFIHTIRDFLRNKGFYVTLNDPYKGVELVKKYSQPTRGRHSLQLEINRALYMDEHSSSKTPSYDALKNEMTELVELCTQYARENLTDLAAD